jgi:hypothetical protein
MGCALDTHKKDKKSTHNLVGKSEGKKPLGQHTCRQNNIKIVLK